MSEDGTRLAVGVHNRGTSHISIRDSGSGRQINRIEFPGYLVDIELTADGSRIAAAFYKLEEPKDARIRVNVWDSSTGELVQSLPMLPYFSANGRGRFTARILWSPDGTRLLRQSLAREATDIPGEYRTVIQIVDVASRGELWQREMPGHGARLWSPDGKLLVIVEAARPGVKPNVQLWDSGTGTNLAILDREDTAGVHFQSNINFSTKKISPDATKIVLEQGNLFVVWDLVKNQGVCRLKIGSGVPPSPSVSPLFSPDGRRVALVSNATTPEEESQNVIHDAQTGEALNVIRVDKLNSTFPASIVNLDFRPDGKQIAALIGTPWPVQNQGPEQIVAWDTANGTKVFSIATVVSTSRALSYSFDGASLMVGETIGRSEEAVVFYNATTGERQRSISLPSSSGSPFFNLRHHFNLRHQMHGATVGSDFVCTDFVLADLATGQERLRLRGYNGVLDMAISPDGSRLVLLRVVNWNIEWTIWSLKSGRQLLAFRHRTERYARDEKVSFSPDGNRLVAIFHPSPLDIKLKPIQVWDATPLPEEPETK